VVFTDQKTAHLVFKR